MRQQLDILKTKIDIIRDHLIVNQVETNKSSIIGEYQTLYLLLIENWETEN